MPLNPLPLMIFAAGFGTRMGDLTRHQPKPMIPVAGRPLIDHALGVAKDAGADPIVLNLHYKADVLIDHLKGQPVTLTVEQPEILDTGGGLRAALPLLGAETVATLNPDVIWRGPNPLKLANQAWDPDTMDALLVCVPLSHTHGRNTPGDFSIDAAGHIFRGGDFVYGGAQILKTGPVHETSESVFSLNEVWNQIATKNRLCAVIYPGEWCDVGTPKGIELAENMLAKPDV